MQDSNRYSINGEAVSEKIFLTKKIYQLNVVGIDHMLEPFLPEIKKQRGYIEYKNDIGVSSVTVHNVSAELNTRIQDNIAENRLEY